MVRKSVKDRIGMLAWGFGEKDRERVTFEMREWEAGGEGRWESEGEYVSGDGWGLELRSYGPILANRACEGTTTVRIFNGSRVREGCLSNDAVTSRREWLALARAVIAEAKRRAKA